MEPGTVITTTSGVSLGDGMDLLVKILGSIMAVVVVVHQGWTRVEQERKRNNGGTDPAKTVNVLEDIRATQRAHLSVGVENSSKLDDMKMSLQRLEQHNIVADTVATKVADALRNADSRREGRKDWGGG